MRRELFFIKAPLFFLLFTLHQIGWNPDKHWGCERWRVTHHSSPLFTTLHLDILFIGLRWVNRAFLLHGLRTDFKRKIDLFGLWRKSHRFGFPFGRRFSIHRFSQIFRVKSGEEWRASLHPCKLLIYRYLYHFREEWRVFLKVACCSDGFAIRRIKRFDLSNLGICNPPYRRRFTSFYLPDCV